MTGLAKTISAPVEEPIPSTYDGLLARIRCSNQLPAIGMAVQKLAAMSDDSSQRMNELANVVLSDIYLTQRVLSLSNTVVYRTHPAPVTTVSKALMLLGLNKVRVLAMSAIVLDYLDDSHESNILKSDFYHAVFASILAAELARETGLADQEEAAIAAMFRSTGRLMLGLFNLPLLKKIKQLSIQQSISERQALMQEAGFSLDDLSRAVLSHWNIPEVLTDAATRTEGNNHSPLALLSQCADQITEVLRTTSIEQDTHVFEQIIGKYVKSFQISKPALKMLISNTRKVAAEFSSVLKWDSHDKSLIESGSAKIPVAANLFQMSENSLVSGVDSNADSLQTTPASVNQNHQTNSTAPVVLKMVDGLQDMIEAIANDQSKMDICRIALETIHRAFNFERSLLCLTDSDSALLTTRIVFGNINPAQRLGFRFNPKNEADGIFSAVCRKNTDIHLREISDGKIKPYLPTWFLKHFPSTRSMALFPVVAGKQVLGLIYGDRNQPSATDFSAQELRMLKTLRNQMIFSLRSTAS